MAAVRIFLLLLVLAEDANFFDVAIRETPGTALPKLPGGPGRSLSLKTETMTVT